MIVLVPILLSFVLLSSIDRATNTLGWEPFGQVAEVNFGAYQEISRSCKDCTNTSNKTQTILLNLGERIDYVSVGCQKRVNDVKKMINTRMDDVIQKQGNESQKLLNMTLQLLPEMSKAIRTIEDINRTTNVFASEMARIAEYCQAISTKVHQVFEEKERAMREKELDNTRREGAVEEKEKMLNERQIQIKTDEEKLNYAVKDYQEKNSLISARESDLIEKQKKIDEMEKENIAERALLEEWKRQLTKDREVYAKKKENLDISREMMLQLIAGVSVFLLMVTIITVFKLIRNRSSSPTQQQVSRLDVCHLSLSGERKSYFETTVKPRLATFNIRIGYQVVQEPSDFNSIPKANSFVVHWVAQRRSIFSSNWTHRGLLKALGRKPFFILVCDQDQTGVLPEGKIYDETFSQIQSEVELQEAVNSACLITYRKNERLNHAQEQVLKNWLNANMGDGALRDTDLISS